MDINEAIRKGFKKEVQEIREQLEKGSTSYHHMDILLNEAGMNKADAIQVVNQLINEFEEDE